MSEKTPYELMQDALRDALAQELESTKSIAADLLIACESAIADYEAEWALLCDPTPVEEPQSQPLVPRTVRLLREAIAKAKRKHSG